ncbi:MAG: hypothetical protein QM770_16380 [Tepidisphaeraceae bacterium]
MMTLRSRIRLKLLSLLLRRQWRLARTIKPATLATFLKTIHPVETNRPLIRVGGDRDGGYLIPDDFDGIVGCFSPGVSTCADFELDLARRGIVSYMADYSVNGPPVQHERFRFEKKFVDLYTDDAHLTLNDWVRRCARRTAICYCRWTLRARNIACCSTRTPTCCVGSASSRWNCTNSTRCSIARALSW